MKLARLIILTVCCMCFTVSAYAASSVYIPGLPSASSSSIGITCQANYPGVGCYFCKNNSAGPLVSSGGAVTSGFSNRLFFVTPGSFSWSVPSGTSTMKLVVIGLGGSNAGCNGVNGGGGGGYSEATWSPPSGTAITVTVPAGGSQGTTQITVAGWGTINATGGSNTTGAGGCGGGGQINTCGGNSTNLGGGGAGGPFANGGGGCMSGGGFGNGLQGICPLPGNGQYGGYAFGVDSRALKAPLGQNGLFWYMTDIQGDGGAGCLMYNNGSGGLGGGGGSGICGDGTGGDGGFGGGGGSNGGCSYLAGNGGIGGGGGGCGCGAPGAGGNGIAIIYW